jgi:hypothetical protein
MLRCARGAVGVSFRGVGPDAAAGGWAIALWAKSSEVTLKAAPVVAQGWLRWPQGPRDLPDRAKPSMMRQRPGVPRGRG